jgi:hypothetical protein
LKEIEKQYVPVDAFAGGSLMVKLQRFCKKEAGQTGPLESQSAAEERKADR